MRAYFFNNMYLSPIQQGIQSAHVLGELMVKYSCYNPEKWDKVLDWAKDHKTMIVLNAGYSSVINEIVENIDIDSCEYPCASFRESDDALCGALTSFGIILPERIYEIAAAVRNRQITIAELELVAMGMNTDILTFNLASGYMVEVKLNNYWHVTEFDVMIITYLNKFGLA